MPCLVLGFGVFFSKLAVIHIDSKSALVFQSLGILIIGFITLSILNFKLDTSTKGVSFGLLSGLASGIGCLFFLIAADKGKASTVVTLTALYPLITIILSYILLRETINLKQFIGIVLALAAIYLMSS